MKTNASVWRYLARWLVVVGGLMIGGCARPPGESATIAASNTYLEAAARDLLGREVAVLRLAEPGMCPGHFDMRPSQLSELSGCQLLLRFDFQRGLDRKLDAAVQRGLRIISVAPDAGLCTPTAYRNTCVAVAAALVEAGMLEQSTAAARLAEVDRALATATADVRARITNAGLADVGVVTSGHQAAFCTFLGLNVLAEFSGTDTALINEIDTAIGAGAKARAIIANRPEGRGLADALAARLDLPVVVLDNFPHPQKHNGVFVELMRANANVIVTTLATETAKQP